MDGLGQDAVTRMAPVSTDEEAAIHQAARPGAWFALWVLVAIALFAFVDRQVLALLTEQVSKSLNLRDTQIGLIQGLGSASFAMLATYPLGWVTDRFDRRIVLGGCVIVWSLGTAACGLAQGFWSLFGAVIAITAGEAGLPALAYSAIPDLFDEKRRVLANQVFYIAMILSSAAGIAFGGAADLALESLKDLLPAALIGVEPWRMIFIIVAAPAPILVGLVAATRLGVRVTPSGPSAVEPNGDLGPYMRRHGRTVALVATSLSFYGLPFLAVLTWTPAALTRLFGATPSQNGLGIGLALGLGCLAGVTLAAWLMRVMIPRLGAKAPLRISALTLLASLPAAGFYPFVANTGQAFAIVGVLMASGTLIGSLLPGILQGLAPPELRGRIVALYGVLSVITGGIGVSLVGPFSDFFPQHPRALPIGVSLLLGVSWAVGALLLRLSEAPYESLQRQLGRVEP